ncbi:OsmC family protein [Ramlibacter solisilvae]|uniref:Peroxiredoxin n=1 Tax=Ramlibacter tataouinensis TaxID=94132 RepID=A0A127JQU0_9BURK|nr:OsmC family protein [Ramlibacter tataouinensis]AMO22336.1 peroxiredoxin [Ramlibacter tataouinensis]
MKRTSSAQWRGAGKSGSGTLDSQSGALQKLPYNFAARFESEDGRAGTNPEELIAAAHAGCFAMALAFKLEGAGHPAEQLDARATVSLERAEGGFRISGVELNVEGRVPGLDAKRFEEIAQDAKANCPVSQALKALPITLNAKLVS